MKLTTILSESKYAIEGKWVVYFELINSRGKKLVKTANTHKGAVQILAKLMKSWPDNVERMGSMPIDKWDKFEARYAVTEEFQGSTLGLSGSKGYAKKHNLSYRTKAGKGRSPYIWYTKDGKEYGPFDTTILTTDFLDKKLKYH